MLIPKTERNNIGLVCESCAEQRKREVNATAHAPAHYVGKYCKLAFPVPPAASNGGERRPTREHMWVRVIMLGDDGGKELLGTLANDPVYATRWAMGDVIDFDRAEIEAVQD